MPKAKSEEKRHEPVSIWSPTFKANYYISRGVPWAVYRETVIRECGTEEWYAHNDDTDVDEHCYGYTTVYKLKNSQVFWMWIEDENIPHLVHEVFHGAFRALRRMGVDLGLASEEVYAYEMEMILRLLLEGKD